MRLACVVCSQWFQTAKKTNHEAFFYFFEPVTMREDHSVWPPTHNNEQILACTSKSCYGGNEPHVCMRTWVGLQRRARSVVRIEYHHANTAFCLVSALLVYQRQRPKLKFVFEELVLRETDRQTDAVPKILILYSTAFDFFLQQQQLVVHSVAVKFIFTASVYCCCCIPTLSCAPSA